MESRLCVVCGAPLQGRQVVTCSPRCRVYRQNHSEAYRATKRRYRERGGERQYPVTCENCGQAAMVTKRDARFCSNRCADRSRRRPMGLVHVGPPTYTVLPPRHPARRPAPRRMDWWKFLVAGPCGWCGETFVGRAASADTATRYCSDRCQRNAQAARRGRFVIADRVRRAIYERDGWVCQLCLEPVDPELHHLDDWAASLDHIVCQSWGEGPDHSPENLRLAHRWCNSVRGDETHHTVDVLRVA